MYCPKCGQEYNIREGVCPECGYDIREFGRKIRKLSGDSQEDSDQSEETGEKEEETEPDDSSDPRYERWEAATYASSIILFLSILLPRRSILGYSIPIQDNPLVSLLILVVSGVILLVPSIKGRYGSRTASIILLLGVIPVFFFGILGLLIYIDGGGNLVSTAWVLSGTLGGYVAVNRYILNGYVGSKLGS